MERFLALYDLHYGYERRNGHRVALHDSRALKAVLQFAATFKPHHVILGGDILDCAAISHHNAGKPGRVEGFRLLADAAECAKAIIEPLEALKPKTSTFIIGNHEDWLSDFTDGHPALEGSLDIHTLLHLRRWKVVPSGGYHNLGKLTFIHGDQISGGEHVAKAAVTSWERNIRFGHHHTYQTYTKTSPISYKNGKTGIAVPCLCTKSPKYGEGRANRWVQGFLYGYVHADGTYNDYVCPIVNSRFVAEGKVYQG